jgi:hypothetical protein
MGSKFTRYPYQICTNIPTSANYSSTAYSLINVDVAAVQIDYTGSSVATFQLQGSCNYTVDINHNVLNAGTFAPLPFLLNGSSAVLSVPIPQNTSPIIFDLYGSGVTAVKVNYQGATSGFFTATVTSKRLGS